MINIMSQTKDTIIRANQIRYAFISTKHCIYANQMVEIGTYDTKERCMEIIEAIYGAIFDKIDCFTMPQK